MIVRTPFHSRERQRGFSLIEVMVAVTILSVMTVGLLAMFYQTQKAFRLGASQTDILEGGRAAMQLMSRELQEMYSSYDDNITNFYALLSSTPTVKMDLPGGGTRTNYIQELTFLSRRGDQWIGTSYRVDDVDTNSGLHTGVGTLYRTSVLTNFYTNAFAVNPRVGVSNLMRLVSMDVVITDNPLLRFDRVIDGVVHLQALAYTERGRLYTNTVFTNHMPAYIDIELGILDPKALDQYRARVSATAAKDFLEQQGYRTHIFKQRIPIRARNSQFDVL